MNFLILFIYHYFIQRGKYCFFWYQWHSKKDKGATNGKFVVLHHISGLIGEQDDDTIGSEAKEFESDNDDTERFCERSEFIEGVTSFLDISVPKEEEHGYPEDNG